MKREKKLADPPEPEPVDVPPAEGADVRTLDFVPALSLAYEQGRRFGYVEALAGFALGICLYCALRSLTRE